tara:strand:- start:235791 stop:236285 length:495 start_codon:yes stop_codon:yes gene_type:complete
MSNDMKNKTAVTHPLREEAPSFTPPPLRGGGWEGGALSSALQQVSDEGLAALSPPPQPSPLKGEGAKDPSSPLKGEGVKDPSSRPNRERVIVQHSLPLTGGGSGLGYRALPLFRAANDSSKTVPETAERLSGGQGNRQNVGRVALESGLRGNDDGVTVKGRHYG